MALNKLEKIQETEKSSEETPKPRKILVVDELPTQVVRVIERDGVLYDLVTVAEYLTSIANARTE